MADQEPVEGYDPEQLDKKAAAVEEAVAVGLELAAASVASDIGQQFVAGPADAVTVPGVWAQIVEDRIAPLISDIIYDTAETIRLGIADAGERLYAGEAIAPTEVLDPRPIDNVTAEGLLSHATNRMQDVGNDLWLNIQQTLAEGVTQGESVPELAERVRQAAPVTEPRARVVARTESQAASNGASIAQARSAGVRLNKTWLATLGDGRTRPAHLAAEGQTVPLDEPFMIGDPVAYPLDFPGDPTGPPELTINCRCTLGYELLRTSASFAEVEVASVHLFTCTGKDGKAVHPGPCEGWRGAVRRLTRAAAQSMGADMTREHPFSEPDRDAIQRYTDYEYKQINHLLRHGHLEGKPDPDWEAELRDVASRLNEAMRPLPQDIEVSRGASLSAFGGRDPQQTVGMRFEDPAFMSTSYDDLSSRRYGGGVELVLDVPAGHPAIVVPADIELEDEIILPPRTSFVVTEVTPKPNGEWKVRARVESSPSPEVASGSHPHLFTCREGDPKTGKVLHKGPCKGSKHHALPQTVPRRPKSAPPKRAETPKGRAGERAMREQLQAEYDDKLKKAQQQNAMEGARAIAELAIEIEEMLAKGASEKGILHTLRTRLKRLRLEPQLKAGDKVKYDPKQHDLIGGARGQEGKEAVVVRPGYTWRNGDKDVLIERPMVQTAVMRLIEMAMRPVVAVPQPHLFTCTLADEWHRGKCRDRSRPGWEKGLKNAPPSAAKKRAPAAPKGTPKAISNEKIQAARERQKRIDDARQAGVPLADRLEAAWNEGDPAATAQLRAELDKAAEAAGVRLFGEPDALVPFDPRIHDTGSGRRPQAGQLVEAIAPGVAWLEEPDVTLKPAAVYVPTAEEIAEAAAQPERDRSPSEIFHDIGLGHADAGDFADALDGMSAEDMDTLGRELGFDITGSDLDDKADFLSMMAEGQTRRARTLENPDGSRLGQGAISEAPQRLTAEQAQALQDVSAPPLTPEQNEAILDYSKTGYTPMNALLRGSPAAKLPAPEDEARYRGEIAAVRSAMQPWPQATVVDRLVRPDAFGIDIDDPQTAEKLADLNGSTFQDQGFLSTTVAELPAIGDPRSALLHIEVPKGTPAAYIQRVSEGGYKGGEEELLLDAGLSYEITDVTTRLDEAGDPVHEVFMRVVPQGPVTASAVATCSGIAGVHLFTCMKIDAYNPKVKPGPCKTGPGGGVKGAVKKAVKAAEGKPGKAAPKKAAAGAKPRKEAAAYITQRRAKAMQQEMLADNPWTERQQDILSDYTGELFEPVNQTLRGMERSNPDSRYGLEEGGLQEAIREIASSMRPTTERITVSRALSPEAFGLPADASDEDVVAAARTWSGHTFQEAAFMSTTTLKDPPEIVDGGGSVVLRLDVPEGTPAAYLGSVSVNEYESEMLLNAGLKYEITDVIVRPGKPVTVVGRVVS